MKFNGVYSGEQINSLSIFEFQKDLTLNLNDKFSLFSIPDEEYSDFCFDKTKPIPLFNTWEILKYEKNSNSNLSRHS